MKKIIFLLLLPFFSYSSEILNQESIDYQSIYYTNEVNIFEWEQMYFFLHNKLYSKKYDDFRLEKTLSIINSEKLNRFIKIKSYFDKNFIYYSSPYITEKGNIFFQNENINRVYEILSQGDNPKEIFKCLCIAQNSLIYKYSVLEFSKEYNMDLFLREIESENIDLLHFIDIQTRDFGFKGCCELANILCK